MLSACQTPAQAEKCEVKHDNAVRMLMATRMRRTSAARQAASNRMQCHIAISFGAVVRLAWGLANRRDKALWAW